MFLWSNTIPSKVLFFKMYVSVVFVRSCLYSAVSLTRAREQRFIRTVYYYYHGCPWALHKKAQPVQSTFELSVLLLD